MDIMPTYSCLLGQPWIHSSGAVPSTLHQKVKVIVNNKLVIIFGEEDMLVSKPTITPYIEAIEKALETAFQSFEIANTSYIKERALLPKHQLSNASMMVAKIMLEKGYHPGDGLGKNQQGVVDIIMPVENKDRYRLGYKPTTADKRRLVEERRERRKARLEGRDYEAERVSICDIRQSFRSAGFMD